MGRFAVHLLLLFEKVQFLHCLPSPVAHRSDHCKKTTVFAKKLVQVVVPGKICVAVQDVPAQDNVEGILLLGQSRKLGKIAHDGLQRPDPEDMGPGLVVVPAVQGDLVVGDPRGVILAEVLRVQKIPISGHAGGKLKAMLFLKVLDKMVGLQNHVSAEGRLSAEPVDADVLEPWGLRCNIFLDTVQCGPGHGSDLVVFIAVGAAEVTAFGGHDGQHEWVVQQGL